MKNEFLMLTISIIVGVASGVLLWWLTDRMVVRVDPENENF